MTFNFEINYLLKNNHFNGPLDDVYHHFDARINFINDGVSFFGNFIPITRNSEFAKYITYDWEGCAFTYNHHDAETSLFGLLVDMGFGIKNLEVNETFVMAPGGFQTEFVFDHQKDGIHIYYHLNYQGLWYDGSKISYSREIPEKSSFIVEINDLRREVDLFAIQLKEFLKKNYPHFIKESGLEFYERQNEPELVNKWKKYNKEISE
jgi:hypothetical protein